MRHPAITSASNPRVREAIAVRDRKHGTGRVSFLIESPNLIEAALEAGNRIEQVFVTPSFMDRQEHRLFLRRLPQTAGVFTVTDTVLRRISDTETPQGIAAVAVYRTFTLDSIRVCAAPLLMVLDSVQDPGNVGTAIRSADAAGADAAVLLPGTCDPLSPKVIRATAGSIFHIPVVLGETGPVLKWLREHKVMVLVADMKAPRSLYQTDLIGPVALVLGNEARGVSVPVREKADLLVRIPIFGRAESLNVGVAASLCLYEAARQRSAHRTV